MQKFGTIVNGDPKVLVEGKPVARKTDLTAHGANLGEGAATVVAGHGLPVARWFDRYLCPMVEDEPHLGGAILTGAGTVLAEGRSVARADDMTGCLGPDAKPGDLDGVSDGRGDLSAAERIACEALWAAYDKEAKDLIAPAGDDHRQRNHIINGAYANLYMSDRRFVWAGLAAYASKQVGCAMDHALHFSKNNPPGATHMSEYMYDMLGKGNRDLFLDIYPIHRFFQGHGYDRLKHCAGARKPPVPAAALDGFAALDRYDKTKDPRELEEHVRAIAWHEQVNVLQRDIYNDKWMQRILDLNEGNVGDAADGPDVDLPPSLKPVAKYFGSKPADVVFSDRCSAKGAKVVPFKRGSRDNLYNIQERMDWIMIDIADHYMKNHGGKDHMDDLYKLKVRGKKHGGKYP